MALVLKDRVLESSTSSGTGSFTLSGAQTGYQSFSVIGNGNTVYYTIQGKDSSGNLTGEWEVGVGTWSTGGTLARDTVLESSNSNAKVDFAIGLKDVFCDLPAEKVITTAGTGISITDNTITNTLPDQTVVLTGAGLTSVTGTYPNFTISSSGGAGGGDVTGPSSAVNNNFTSFDGTTGKLLKDSGYSASSFATYPGTGIPNSTGSAWGTSYSTSGTGTVVVLASGATINSATIGSTTPGSGAFTYLSTSSTTSTTPTLSFNASNSGFAMGATVSGNYLQTLLQNKSGTAGASTNYVLSNDLGTDSTYYGEFGMNASVYSSGTPSDFFSLNNGVYFSSHDGDVTLGSGNGFKTYFAWGTAAQSAHVINASGAIGLNTSITGSTNFGTSGQVLTSAGSSATPTWTTPTTGTVTSASVVSANGFAGSVATATTTPAITLSTTVTGLLKGNGTAISAATSGTDYAPATSGTSILYGNGSGGFSNVTVGSGLSFSTGTLSATGGSMVYPGAGIAVSTGSAWTTSLTAPSGAIVGTTDTQTLSGKTITGTKETVYTITDGAAFEIDPANGGIQTITLTASRTPAATNFTAGQSVTLMINDGTAYTITWTTVGVVWVGGSAPTLATTGYTVIELWKVASTIYGAYVGAVA